MFIMDEVGMNREKVPSSDCDENEDEDLLTVINEHSEVIGLITDDRNTNSQSGQNDAADSNEIEIFHTPPDVESDSHETTNGNGNGDESDSDQNNSFSEVHEDDSDSEDGDHYIVYQEENNRNENNFLPEIPIVNYAGDVEHEEDFGNGWEWNEKDPGSSCGPFIGNPGLLIQPQSHTPEGFFNLLFDNSMWTLIAQQTNIYARQRIQQLRGIIFILYICLQHILKSSSVSYCSRLFMVFHP